MIDIKKAENAFNEYLKQYDLTDEKISSKVIHTYGVVRECERLAKVLNLDKEDTEIAKLIALLHDIGRFEQASKCKIYDEAEANIDHAQYGVKILFEDKLIRKFVEDDSYDNIIYKAIENHNKLEIEPGLNEKELLHTKIIRDCDKTDNLIKNQTIDLKIILGIENIESLQNEIVSDTVYEIFLDAKPMHIKYRKTPLDRWIGIIAFIFDYNFNESLKYIYDNNCVNNLFDRINYENLETKERMQNMKKFANEYVKKRLN